MDLLPVELPAKLLKNIAFPFTKSLIPLTKPLSKRVRALLTGVVIFVVIIVLLALVQFVTSDLAGNDGYYHIKIAQLMRTEGLKPDFTWLPLTILNAREFYDHHFLYHVALIPFTFGDLRLGAKLSAVVFSSIAFLSIWWLLYQQKVRYSGIWALGLLAISEAFIYRMSIPRAQSLSLLVLVIGLHLLLTRRFKWMLPLGFIYVWLYDAFPLLLAGSIIYVVAVLILERRLEWAPLIYTSAGIALGSIINPYFPDNIVFTFRHLLPKLTGATAVSVGNEWYPYTTNHLLENSPLALLVFVSGILALGLSPRKMDIRTATSLILAVLFGLLLFQARRFIEYFPAFALIFAAFAWADYLSGREGGVSKRENEVNEEAGVWSGWVRQLLPYGEGKYYLRKWLPAMFMFLFLVPGMIFTLTKSRISVGDSKPHSLFAGAAGWLEENTLPGSRVFQTDWDDFPRLFYYNTHNTYLVGLDPTYMQLYNPELYDEWVEITKGRIENPSEVLRDRFASSYVVSDLKHGSFLDVAERDPGLVKVYEDEQSVVFQLIGLEE